MISCKRFALIFLLALSLAAFASCASDDDDDDSGGVSAADDANDDTTDDDADDDVDDDADDDVDDDADDDVNDDTDDDVDDDLDDDLDDDSDDDTDDDVNDDADDDADDDVNDDADDDTQECIDEDGDGYGDNCIAGPDCDDADPFINPSSPELPGDGIDQNCDDVDLICSNGTGVFVATTGDDTNPGTMAAPLLTINAGAILALQAGKSVFVATGDYLEDVVTQVSLFGGYESAGWTRDITVHFTSIDAATTTAIDVAGDLPISIQGFLINGGAVTDVATSGINIAPGSSVMLRENTIGGGSGMRSSGVKTNDAIVMIVENVISGGTGGIKYGIQNYGDSELRLTNNVISGGSGGGYSHGVFSEGGGTATITDNHIDGGSAEQSHGLYNNSGNFLIIENTINGGAGIFNSKGVHNAGMATLVNNTINGGSGGESSVGVFGYNAKTILVNNTINGGSGSDYSKGVCFNTDFTGCTYKLVNNFIDGGSGAQSIGIRLNAIFGRYGEGTVVNNNIWGENLDTLYNSITLLADLNSCGWRGCVEASGNISADPLFVDPASGDYHLQDTSPCIDAGINPIPTYISPGLVEFDFDGDPRPYGASWDIGPDEWRP